MALDKAALEAAILAALNAAQGQPDPNPVFAASLATAIDTFVKTGTAVGLDTPSGDSHALTIQ